MGISYYFDWKWFEIPVSVSWTEVSISLLRPAKYVTVDWFQSLPNFAASPSPAEITILRTSTVNWINFIGFVNMSVCNSFVKGERESVWVGGGISYWDSLCKALTDTHRQQKSD